MSHSGLFRLIAVGVLAAACGGAATATSAPATRAPGTPTGSAPASAPATAAAPTAAGATQGPGEAPVVPANQCQLASNEEISAAAGVTVSDAVDTQGGGCTWNDANGGLVVNALYLSGDLADSLWTSMQNPALGGVPVSGLGDGAVWVANTTSLMVRDGESILQIGVALTLGDDAKRRGIAEAVARLILPRV
jgi:hypothetical protein